MKVKFRCPQCNCEQQIEEVLTNVYQYSTIVDIDEDGCVDYGRTETLTEDGEITHYQCANCSWEIPNIDMPEDLFKWLKENNMLEGIGPREEIITE